MSLKACAHRRTIAIASTLLTVSVAHGQTVNRPLSSATGGPDSAPPAQGTRAEALTYGAAVGIGESDNVTLVETNKVSQTIAIADLDFDFKDQSRRFDLDAKGNFSYLDYLQNAYSNQLIGRFDGRADVAIIPERVVWVLTENFGQSQIDPFLAMTPTNLQNVNYVATGPDFALKLGSTVFLDLGARYARTTYETDPFDSNRINGTAALGVVLSARSSASIVGNFDRVMFDNTEVNTDFDRSRIYGHYELEGARTNLTANIGATKVDEGAESFTGPSAKLQLSRKLSSVSKLTFTVGRDITDASTGFANLQSGAIGGIVSAPAAVSLTNYFVTYGSVGWEYARNRTTFGVSGTWEKDTYHSQPLQDLTRDGAEFRVERKLSSVLTAQILGSVYRTDYPNADFAETDGRIGAAMTFREGRGLEIQLRYDHTSRIVSGAGSGYKENRAFLTIGYRPRTQQST
jgi:hypothetical protein